MARKIPGIRVNSWLLVAFGSAEIATFGWNEIYHAWETVDHKEGYLIWTESPIYSTEPKCELFKSWAKQATRAGLKGFHWKGSKILCHLHQPMENCVVGHYLEQSIITSDLKGDFTRLADKACRWRLRVWAVMGKRELRKGLFVGISLLACDKGQVSKGRAVWGRWEKQVCKPEHIRSPKALC